MKKSEIRKAGKLIIVALITLTAILVLAACNARSLGTIKGNGKMVNKEFTIEESIKTIAIERVSATLNVSAEHSGKVTYSVDENLSDRLDINLSNGLLKIKPTVRNSLGQDRKIVFNIGANLLEKLSISGDAKVVGSGTFSAENFNIDVSGEASIKADLDVNKVIIDTSGDAEIELSGRASTLNVDCSGDGFIKAKALISGDAVIDVSGACDIEVYAENTLLIDFAGAGTLTYWGDADIIKQDVAGSGSIKKGN